MADDHAAADRRDDAVCICGHYESQHSEKIGYANGCRRCWDCQAFIARDCICGDINARHCPVHG